MPILSLLMNTGCTSEDVWSLIWHWIFLCGVTELLEPRPSGQSCCQTAIPQQKCWFQGAAVTLGRMCWSWEGLWYIPRKPKKWVCIIPQCLELALLPSHRGDTSSLLNSTAPNTRAIPAAADFPPSSSSATALKGVPCKTKVPVRHWSLQPSNPGSLHEYPLGKEGNTSQNQTLKWVQFRTATKTEPKVS